MPARDLYHNNVKNALIKEEWIITHDPLILKLGKFEEPIGKLLLRNRRLKLITFNPKQEVIKQWIAPS